MSTQEVLIRALNPIIRGWCNYHRHVVSKRIFSKMENRIYWTIWRWIKRKHPRKRIEWIKKKYFLRIEARNRFAVQVEIENKKQIVKLICPDMTKIVRRIKIKKEANPYDPAWKTYIEGRRKKRKPWESCQRSEREKNSKVPGNKTGHDVSVNSNSAVFTYYILQTAELEFNYDYNKE